jgi:23S rRNA (cytidine1920-2'-O)/16S rRNA (cytidine1409-2'-O)-methyltransferase
MPRPSRLDQVLVDRRLAETRSRAKALILAGDVLVNGQKETRAGHPVGAKDEVALRAVPRFVSRGGEKLDHALESFRIDVTGMVAADLGASTGGFTDCLLQRGAARVYAIDVGYGQIDERLRTDDRVVVMERVNARYLESLPEPVQIVVIDVSFISLNLMFPVVARILADDGICVPLIKPQFEAGRDEVGKGGVVRDPDVHRQVMVKVVQSAVTHGFVTRGLVASPLRGPAGNIEFLAEFRKGSRNDGPTERELSRMIDAVMEQATTGAPSQ